MPWFTKSPEKSSQTRDVGRGSQQQKSSGLFVKSEDKKSKSQHQPPAADFKHQAMSYGMDLSSKRDQQMKEQRGIEKKMAKQSGRKISQGGCSSKKEDAKTAFKVANFIRKNT